MLIGWRIFLMISIFASFYASETKDEDVLFNKAKIDVPNLPPEISVSGRKAFCPGEPILIAENFSISDPDDNAIAFFSVQISSGYITDDTESLFVSGEHPAITSAFDFNTGTLTISPAIGFDEILYSDLIPAVRDIKFETLAPNVSGERFFSFNIGDANFLPSTGHYYEFVSSPGIRWSDAKEAAENREYFGLQGYLVTILSEDEAQISGEQAAGAGWIGGSDEEEEGVWKWVTGPEAGIVFWRGDADGTPDRYAKWNIGEPNDFGNEDYAHITDASIGIRGAWNDLPNQTLVPSNDPYYPRGYIVEYGGMPGDPELNISGSTSIYIPEITSVSEAEACPGARVVLEATASEGEVFWYDRPSGGDLVFRGNTFETPALNETTTYYVAAAPLFCENTPRTPVVVTISELPEVNDAVVLKFCKTAESEVATFDLTSANSLISDNYTNESFTYFKSQEDAESNSNAITNPESYQNLTDINETIWVRTTNDSGCFVVSTILLQITSLFIPDTFSRLFEQCDDYIDEANNDIDGISTFDFNGVTQEIINLFPSEQSDNISISHFPSEQDAINETNQITDIGNFRNTIPNTQQIYTKVTNAENDNCVYIGSHITLNVTPVPVVNALEDWNLCDDDLDGDDTNGFIQNIDLESRTPLILGDQDLSLFTVTYHESSEDAETGENALTSPYTNTTKDAQTFYIRVVSNITGCFVDRTSFTLNIRPLPVIGNEVTLNQCDTDLDGFMPFDLNESKSLISANYENESFQFYQTLSDAESAINLIQETSAYVNQIPYQDKVWVRTFSEFGCYRISEINLSIAVTHIPDTFSRVYEQCDDYINDIDNDADGASTFDFSEVTQEMMNLFPPEQADNITITHFPTETDAINGTNQITDIGNYRNTLPNTQQIYTRVTNAENENCVYVGTHITLNVIPVPVVNILEDWNVCDDDLDGDDTNGFIQNIDLESRTPLILGDQDVSLFTVTYHESSEDAKTGNNALSSPYTNITKDSQIFYVRVVDNVTGCFADRTSFTLNIQPLPVINDVVELKQCDTDLDGFIQFNLNEAGFDISSNYQNETFTFYESLSDAENNINPIENSTSYTNEIPTQDKVWARAISEFGCYRIAEVNLTVSTTGVPPTFQRSFTACDDLIDGDDTDGVTSFDFSAVSDEIRELFPANQQLTITYYRNVDDALSELNVIEDPTNYRNIGYPNTQDIYIRVDSDLDNDCLGLGHHITLNVEPVPTANETPNIEECDDMFSGSTTDGSNSSFNLRAKVQEILGDNQSESDYKVTFHTTKEGALDGISDLILNDSDYTSIPENGFQEGTKSEQTIHVRVEALFGNGCYNANTSFKIIIHPLPQVSSSISNLPICETETALDSDPRNRMAQGIDLTAQAEEILAGRTDLNIEYYNTETDAENRQSPIKNPEGYQNIDSLTRFPADFSSDDPAFQTIYFVLVDQNGLQCASLFSSFELVIHPEPNVFPVNTYFICDDDADGDDTNGIVQNIDFSTVIPEILGEDRSSADYTITFHTSSMDADTNSNAITFPYENNNPTETIFIRIENNITSCVSSTATFQSVVNVLPSFVLDSPQTLCLNALPYNIQVTDAEEIYAYEWRDEEGILLGTNNNLDISDGGVYQVTATNTITQCSRTEFVLIEESNIATVEPSFVTVIDESNSSVMAGSLSVSIDIINNDLGIGDYQFALLNTDTDERFPFAGYQDEPVFDGIEGGVYQVIVNDKNGCSPDTVLLVSVLQFPKFFTPNGDGFNDFWFVKGTNKDFYPTSSIRIFNRFGKLVSQFEAGDSGWDGTFNSNLLPTDDYWYNITLVPSDPDRPTVNKIGHFSLLRR